MTAIRSRAPFEEAHPSALALYCSDGRLTRSIEELLQTLGHERHDTLTLPGGPGLLSHWTARHGEAYTVKHSAEFLIRALRIRTVCLVSHAGCGYYSARYGDHPPAEREERALRDLREAIRAVHEIEPSLDVHAFFARPDAGHVRFDPVV